MKTETAKRKKPKTYWALLDHNGEFYYLAPDYRGLSLFAKRSEARTTELQTGHHAVKVKIVKVRT